MIFSAATSLFARFAAAANCSRVGIANDATCETNLPGIAANQGTMTLLLQIIFGVLGAAAVLVITIAAMRLILAEGDPQGVAKARQAIVFALVGLVVAISAEGIVTFVVRGV